MKKAYVFQGYDGIIYGEEQIWTPQQAGKVNAQNRREGSQGRWMEKEYLTEKELGRKHTPVQEPMCACCGRSLTSVCDKCGKHPCTAPPCM